MNVYFHVVTSVKGGSGKSTVALLLADYLLSKEEDAYVIDLDVCGTSWLKDFSFAYNSDPTKFINRMMYQSCTKGYGDDVWSNLTVIGTGPQDRKIKVCLAANEQLSHSINKSEAELIEHTTYHLIKDAMHRTTRGGKEKLHIIFDLPPSHETTVEQICHHLLFDQRSVLKRDFIKEGVSQKVFFYLISPADQGSALIKNIDYLKKFKSNPTYSESLGNNDWFAWQIINDNHNWAELQGKDISDMALSVLKNTAIDNVKVRDRDGLNTQVLVMKYCNLGYKKHYFFGEYKIGELGLTTDSVDTKKLNISTYEVDPFDTIWNRIREEEY